MFLRFAWLVFVFSVFGSFATESINVFVVSSHDFQLAQPESNWTLHVQSLIEDANQTLGVFVDKKFVISEFETINESQFDLSKMRFEPDLRLLQKAYSKQALARTNSDLVVFFDFLPDDVFDKIKRKPEALISDRVVMGGAQFYEPYVFVRAEGLYAPNLMRLRLIHELAHVFGAVEISDQSSIMYSIINQQVKFDPY